METYIVGLDGSPLAEATLPYATALAKAAGARLALVQAVPEQGEADPIDLPLTGEGIARPARWEATNAAVRAAEEYLLSIARHLREEGLTTQIVVKVGEPAEVLLGECREPGADLILLGTHGRSGLSRLLYGSVAEAVLRHTPVPLFLVPARAVGNSEASVPRTLVVPLDGSPLAEAALPEAFRLSQLLHAGLRLLRVVPPSTLILAGEGSFSAVASPDLLDAEEEGAEVYLQRMAERIRAHGLTVTSSVLFDQPGPAIRYAAQDLPGALIVMATHARGSFSQALLGSVAVDVVRHGTAPVVLVRPSGVSLEEQTPAVGLAGRR
ncbi:MAG TPA: universal stress protein [Chloroflexota bacterium]|nr:universal stress protein [Chloroflexota bacterium]